MTKKGSFQLSLGFIIAVVFSVILLSLAITWIQDLMKNMNVITDDLTQQASAKLKETFSKTNNHLSIWPSEYDLQRGHVLKTLVGIINKEPDSSDHRFSIYVKSNNNVDSWIDKSSYENQEFNVQFNKILEIPVTITPPPDAPVGTYTFWVYGCIDRSPCTESNSNYESPQYLRIKIV